MRAQARLAQEAAAVAKEAVTLTTGQRASIKPQLC